MKSKYIIVAILTALIYTSCKKDNKEYDLDLPPDITSLSVSKGDTSVFLKWNAVPTAHSYLIVRGRKVIAENLKEPQYEDALGPDTLVEYRVYAVNKDNWRSYNYASDSGFVAIPKGVLPRPPLAEASTEDYKYCTLTWSNGRFATAYNIFKNGVLIGDNVQGNTFIDKKASTSLTEYRIYAVNHSGVSLTYTKVMGVKPYYYQATFDSDEVGFEYIPWTFRAKNIAYYTEGGPTVTNTESYAGGKSLKVTNGKIQLLCDWGGVTEKGRYKISVMVKKAQGGFWMVPSFSGAQHISAGSEWTKFEVETPLLNKGGTFSLKIEPYGNGSAFIDNWSIEYVGSE
ncbi:fibronectin type III domain-containing protein [Pedobacter endophyticus]|uniref:Fibronectin type-III domain-containing protein n=1 Tax=Pedobacter endophyticus TaxID=2789740 RepID=A0A7U3SPA5_9SPHI|nr:hypothetical protein [Pedobacter endophyticus]QPH37851.1 hypothetical protein IZT61_12090 [Pedobacter endophyticus]